MIIIRKIKIIFYVFFRKKKQRKNFCTLEKRKSNSHLLEEIYYPKKMFLSPFSKTDKVKFYPWNIHPVKPITNTPLKNLKMKWKMKLKFQYFQTWLSFCLFASSYLTSKSDMLCVNSHFKDPTLNAQNNSIHLNFSF